MGSRLLLSCVLDRSIKGRYVMCGLAILGQGLLMLSTLAFSDYASLIAYTLCTGLLQGKTTGAPYPHRPELFQFCKISALLSLQSI